MPTSDTGLSALCNRQAAALSLCTVQNKRRRMTFYAMAQHAHNAYTALLATAQRTPQRSAIFLDAKETL